MESRGEIQERYIPKLLCMDKHTNKLGTFRCRREMIKPEDKIVMANYFILFFILLQKSMYGGGAWNTSSERSGEYYLHQFLHNQPDLNLRSPQVKEKLNVRSRNFHQGVVSSLILYIVGLRLKLHRVYVYFAGNFDALVEQVGGWVLH